MEQAKVFLAENRPSVVAIFKRQTKIGPKPPAHASEDVREIIDLFVLLIAATEFLEVSLIRIYIARVADMSSSMKSKGIPNATKHLGSPEHLLTGQLLDR